jgi:antitoxin component YwqK of YwqJK toxin-antitoxin module
MEVEYQNNDMHGKSILWQSNGRKLYEIEYRYGKLERIL